MTRRAMVLMAVAVVVALAAVSCAKKPAPVAKPIPPPASGTGSAVPPPEPPMPVAEPVPVEPVPEDTIGSLSLDDLNRDSPLQPVFFGLDAFDLSDEAQQILQQNARLLQQYATWQVTVEGHCDERGTAEYNLALGERRAQAARDYLLSLGIPAARLRTVSYGKEFPFDPGHGEAAWSKNRRAHFVITAR